MSTPSHKSSSKKIRPVQAPRRSNGKLRVAAILEAAAAIIDEKGYELATMAEIAAKSNTKIGSLYRFFPNKNSLADTIIVSARKNLDTVFDNFDVHVSRLSTDDLADNLTDLILDLFNRPALMKLLDASQDWSVNRAEFKKAMLHRIANTLRIRSPKLGHKIAGDMALVILLNAKAMATDRRLRKSTSGTVFQEFREMVRLYLQSKLGPAISRKNEME